MIEYKEFKLDDLFEQIKFSSEDKPKGMKADYPKVKTEEYCIGLTCAMTTNGNIGGYARRESCSKIVSNVISGNANGGALHCWYHADQIAQLQDSWIIKLKDKELNTNIALYLCTCLNKIGSKYHFALKPGWNRIKEDKISLPINSEGNPNWEYIETYIQNLKREIVPAYLNKLNQAKQNNTDVSILEREVEYKQFKIKDIFNIESGDTDIQTKHINGKGNNVVAAGIENRGYAGCSDIKAKIFKSNTLTTDLFGNTFYRNNSYKVVTHNRIFVCIPKTSINENIGLYLEACMNKFSTKYNYGYACNRARLYEELIKLPIDLEGNPDWEYMDKYIAVLRKQNENFINRKIQKLQEFVGD